MTQYLKSKIEKITELLKVVIWPIVVVFILLLYYSDIKDLIKNSTRVSVGSFSMEIMKEARNQGLSELGEIITSLEEDELRNLLTIAESGNYGLIGRNNTYYFLTDKSEIWGKLESKGLVKFSNFSLEEVKKYLMEIGAEKTTVYYNIKGEFTNNKSSEFHIKSDFYEVRINKISELEKRKLEDYSIQLTEKGKRAIDIIVKTVTDELKK